MHINQITSHYTENFVVVIQPIMQFTM